MRGMLVHKNSLSPSTSSFFVKKGAFEMMHICAGDQSDFSVQVHDTPANVLKCPARHDKKLPRQSEIIFIKVH